VAENTFADLPEPLRQAMSLTPVPDVVVVAGCEISWLSWGDSARQPLIFIHGGAAHSWWWSFTAPLLRDRHHVVTLDLSGHGDSGHRPRYSFAGWVEEVVAVMDRLPGRLPPIVVGHSMGGIVATLLAHRHGDRLAGLVIVDAPLSRAGAAAFSQDNQVLAQPRRYASGAEATARFRLLPPQDLASPELLSHVARHSVTSDGDAGGWSWKFDAKVFSEHPEDRPENLLDMLGSLTCPLGVIVGEKSEVVSAADRAWLAAMARKNAGDSSFAHRLIDGGHHLMFDRPLELVAAIGEIIAGWGVHPEQAEGVSR